MAYVRTGLGATPSDTAAYHQLHDAAVAAANARRYGTPQQAAGARQQLAQVAAARTEQVKALQQAEAQPGFLDRLRDILTGAGKWAAIGIGLLVVAPLLIGMRPRHNPHRGRRRGRHG